MTTAQMDKIIRIVNRLRPLTKEMRRKLDIAWPGGDVKTRGSVSSGEHPENNFVFPPHTSPAKRVLN
jgi:hypothetical protein